MQVCMHRCAQGRAQTAPRAPPSRRRGRCSLPAAAPTCPSSPSVEPGADWRRGSARRAHPAGSERSGGDGGGRAARPSGSRQARPQQGQGAWLPGGDWWADGARPWRFPKPHRHGCSLTAPYPGGCSQPPEDGHLGERQLGPVWPLGSDVAGRGGCGLTPSPPFC